MSKNAVPLGHDLDGVGDTQGLTDIEGLLDGDTDREGLLDGDTESEGVLDGDTEIEGLLDGFGDFDGVCETGDGVTLAVLVDVVGDAVFVEGFQVPKDMVG